MSETTAIAKKHDGLKALLGRIEDQVARALPEHMNSQAMTDLIIVEATRNEDILACVRENPMSVIRTVLLASQLGLRPSGPLGLFYCIPRRMKLKGTNEKPWTLTGMIGYRGYAELARRSPDIERLNAGVVYQEELEGTPISDPAFRWTNEPPSIQHRGDLVEDRSDKAIVLVYAVATLVGGQRYQVVLDRQAIDLRRRRAQTDYIWKSDFGAMARKSAIRALLAGGLVPLTAELATASAHDAPVEVERADVVDAPAARLVDPVRAALGMDQADEDQIAEGEAKSIAWSQLVDKCRALETSLLSASLVREAFEAAKLNPDLSLDEQSPIPLETYLKELQSRAS